MMNDVAAPSRLDGWLTHRPASRSAVAKLVAFLVVVVALGAAHIPPATFQGPMLVTAWTLTGPEAIHQLHGLFNGVWVVLLYASLAALLFRPARRPAVVVFVAAVVAAGIVRVLASPVIFADAGAAPLVLAGVLTVALIALAPGLRAGLRPAGRIDPIMAGLAGAGVLAALAYAGQQLLTWNAAAAADPHSQFAHWVLMAGITGLVALGVGLGALRLPGSRLPLWLGAMAAAYLAVASIIMPGQPSALPLWAAVGVLLLSVATVGRFEMVAVADGRRASPAPRPAEPQPGPAVAGG